MGWRRSTVFWPGITRRCWGIALDFLGDPSLAAIALLPHREDGLESARTHSEPCPRCGGELEFKDTVESPTTGSPVHFFQCKDCGHIHSVEL